MDLHTRCVRRGKLSRYEERGARLVWSGESSFVDTKACRIGRVGAVGMHARLDWSGNTAREWPFMAWDRSGSYIVIVVECKQQPTA